MNDNRPITGYDAMTRAPFEYGDSQFTSEALAEKQLAKMEAEIERLRNTLKLHAGDCQSLNGEVTMFKERAEEAEAEIEQLTGSKAALQTEIERLRGLMDAHEENTKGVYANAEAEIERLTALAQSNDDITWELTGENVRLRAALQAMMDGEPNAAQMAARALEPKP